MMGNGCEVGLDRYLLIFFLFSLVFSLQFLVEVLVLIMIILRDTQYSIDISEKFVVR